MTTEEQNKNITALLARIFGSHTDRSGTPAYRTRIGQTGESVADQNKREIILPTDLEQAALSLEYERRGFNVDYVARKSLPAGKPWGKDQFSDRKVTIVVDSLDGIEGLRKEIRKTPERFADLIANTRHEVNLNEEFNRIATSALKTNHKLPHPG